MYRPAKAKLQLKSGELQAGDNKYMFMFDWSAITTPPPPQKATLASMRTLL
jgi:hypothetical protein